MREILGRRLRRIRDSLRALRPARVHGSGELATDGPLGRGPAAAPPDPRTTRSAPAAPGAAGRAPGRPADPCGPAPRIGVPVRVLPNADADRPDRADRPAPHPAGAALACARDWGWPVLPGVGRAPERDGVLAHCACPDRECQVPGGHPFEPGLLAATTDARMIAWWWSTRPTAPILLATGGAAPCAVSLPAAAAASAVRTLDAAGVRLGPIVAGPSRWTLLVAPYSLEFLGELLWAQDRVPAELRFHGPDGYAVLPGEAPIGAGPDGADDPTRSAQRPGGNASWRRHPEPAEGGGAWLPRIGDLVETLIEATLATPGGGSRLSW
ncbi:bifunctional DNA primase/polymerase [Streptomyces sp. BI20]|uniref:bifunctional DNA primase/polymerase n=1 Tax=Streptomyces sp. BI20 TaxID=3403460 RepID=UPI003C7922CF